MRIERILLSFVIVVILSAFVLAAQLGKGNLDSLRERQANSSEDISEVQDDIASDLRERVEERIENEVSLDENEETEESGLQTERSKGRIIERNVKGINLNITPEQIRTGEKLQVVLSNGRNAEIKTMPETASQKAIEVLGRLNFTIQLKEVRKRNETRIAYEMKAEKKVKFLGLFETNMDVEADIDAETGEVLKVKKPWWAFLAREKEPEEDDSDNDDETTEFNVGYKIIEFQSNGKILVTAVWYPTDAKESSYSYGSGEAKGKNALNSKPVEKEFPFVVFSHGFGGCGVQSVFFTEELARHGYIVAAPDHDDAKCSIYPDGKPLEEFSSESFGNPSEWSDSSYIERKEDIELIINEMLKLNSEMDSDFYNIIDENKIGISGHSLGGYSAMALAGGWDSWKDSRIKATLLFSPYSQPFLESSTVGNINVPVMYQGGTLDLGITPSIKKEGGTYDLSNKPKFFLEIKGIGHMGWTNKICGGKSVSECIALEKVWTINNYGFAFLDKYLKLEDGSDLQLTKSDLSALKIYEYDIN